MGRIKTQWIKRLTNTLIEKHEAELTDDFNKNKELVGRVTDASSKKIVNAIAGYATRLVKMRRRKEL
jgi:ribosomal protein S17E